MALYQDPKTYSVAKRRYTLEEWRNLEESTGEKYEFLEGRIIDWRAMAGGSPTHAKLTSSLLYLFEGGVRERERKNASSNSCNVYSSDLQLKVGQASNYVYPDAAIVCGKPISDSYIPTAISNPCVVAEVLSPSSFTYDMGRKFNYYAKMPSLREYIIVYQTEWTVEVRSREESGGPWKIEFFHELDHIVLVPSISLELPMSELYRGVKFEDEEE